MKSTIQYIGVVVLTIMVASCSFQSKEVKQNKELEKLALDVMEVHDRSMPNHGKLFKLRKKLMDIQECYNDTLIKNDAMIILVDIQTADNDMMEWMHSYTAPEDFLPFEEKKTYYIHQRQVIADVETFMNTTIEKANQLINKYPIKKECQEL